MLKLFIPALLLSSILSCADCTAQLRCLPIDTYGQLVQDATIKHYQDTLVNELRTQTVFLRNEITRIRTDYSNLIGSFYIERDILMKQNDNQKHINDALNKHINDLARQNVKLRKADKIMKVLAPVSVGIAVGVLFAK